MKGIRNARNYTNSFTDSDDVSTDLSLLFSNLDEGIFGVEQIISSGYEEMENKVISPPHLRLRRSSTVSRLEALERYEHIYEGYLSRPFFLPLYGGMEGAYMDNIETIQDILTNDEEVFVQWLFRKADDWQSKAIDMYESYLEGNDDPLPFKLARHAQDRALEALNRISSTNMVREPDPEIEEKIIGKGYRFQLRIGIHSDRPEELMKEIRNTFVQYDAKNGIRFFRMNPKRCYTSIDMCEMKFDAKYQILSPKELYSLFQVSIEFVAPAEVQEVLSKSTSNYVSLLPQGAHEEPEIDDNLIPKLAEALKRVKLTNQARIYNEEIIAGVRLAVIQFDIPKDRNLTDIQKQSKNIQAAMGVPALSITQGEEPDTVKVMLPIDDPLTVNLRNQLEDLDFEEFKQKNPLAFVAGVDEMDQPIHLSLAKMVHLLVAGSTGSGKSVFLNSVITTLLINYKPEELQMVMIDPKEVELSHFEQFPHVEEVITDMREAGGAINRLVVEMDNRYTMLKEAGAKNIAIYNKKHEVKMPYIVCVVDEYADLKSVNKDIEENITRIGQKARACGIHLIIATQRPSVKIISGELKAVIPSAIAFNLNTNTDYKTVFGTGIPFNLLGRGDGCMSIEGDQKEFRRFQSPIISPDELEEENVLHQLATAMNGGEIELVAPQTTQEPEPEPIEEEVIDSPPEEVPSAEDSLEDELLYRLKQEIASTKETKVTKLRQALGIKTSTMTNLMTRLVEEGWLKKHASKAKGYEIILSDDQLSEWKT